MEDNEKQQNREENERVKESQKGEENLVEYPITSPSRLEPKRTMKWGSKGRSLSASRNRRPARRSGRSSRRGRR